MSVRRAWLLPLLLFPAAARADPGWTIDAGIAVVRQPDYPGSASSRLLVRPTLAATDGDRLRFSIDDGVSWAAFDLGKLKLGPVAEYRQADRISPPGGYPGMGSAIELGGFARLDTPIAELEGRLRKAVDGYRGWSADLAADSGITVAPGTKLAAEARLSWADYRFVESRFGPGTLRGRRPGMPDFDPPNYVSAGIELDATQRIGSAIDVTLIASDDRLIGDVRSPQVMTHVVRQLGLSVTRHFRL